VEGERERGREGERATPWLRRAERCKFKSGMTGVGIETSAGDRVGEN